MSDEQTVIIGGEEWTVIHTYTRAQALEDGELVDVTETAKEAGIKYPVAATRALWSDIEAIPANRVGLESVDGRLWDVVWMLLMAISGRLTGCQRRATPAGGEEVIYPVYMTMPGETGGARLRRVKAICGPDDNGAPCITLMRPEED